MPDPDRPPVRWSRPSCSFTIRLTVHPVGPSVRPSYPPRPCVLSVLTNPYTLPVLSVHPVYPAHPPQASSHCCSLVRLSVRPSVLQSVRQSVSPPHQPVPSVPSARPVCNVRLSVHPSGLPSARPSVRPPVRPPVRPAHPVRPHPSILSSSFIPSEHPSVCSWCPSSDSVRPSGCASVRPSVYPSVRPSVPSLPVRAVRPPVRPSQSIQN